MSDIDPTATATVAGNGAQTPKVRKQRTKAAKTEGKAHDNAPTPEPAEVVRLHPTVVEAIKASVSQAERQTLDEAERLAADAILDDDDGDAPSDKEEIAQALIVKKLPRYSHFRASPMTFDLWGTTDRAGMDDLLFVTTKSFAPNFEDDVDLVRVRFFETVTSDGVVRLVWCTVPEKGGRLPNSWQTSKLAALEHAQQHWTTMRSRKLLSQYTFRPSRNQNRPEPKFSGRSAAQWLLELKNQGMLVDSTNHDFFKKATDSE
jgi:hypothetical protein